MIVGSHSTHQTQQHVEIQIQSTPELSMAGQRPGAAKGIFTPPFTAGLNDPLSHMATISTQARERKNLCAAARKHSAVEIMLASS